MNHLQNSCLGLHQIDWIKHTCELGWVGPLFSIRQGRRRRLEDTSPLSACQPTPWGVSSVQRQTVRSSHLSVCCWNWHRLPRSKRTNKCYSVFIQRSVGSHLAVFEYNAFKRAISISVTVCGSLLQQSGWGHDRERLLCSDSTDSPQLRVSWKKGELTWWLRETGRHSTAIRKNTTGRFSYQINSLSPHLFTGSSGGEFGGVSLTAAGSVSTDGPSLDSTPNPKRPTPSVTMWKSWETSQSSLSPFWQTCVICVSFVWCP